MIYQRLFFRIHLVCKKITFVSHLLLLRVHSRVKCMRSESLTLYIYIRVRTYPEAHCSTQECMKYLSQ